MIEQLLECYGAIEALTARLRTELESDNAAALDSLVDERGELVQRAGAMLQAVTSDVSSGPGTEDASGRWDAVRAAARRAVEADEQLRALLAARSSEIPSTLAELRGGRLVLEGYGGGPVPPESVDRRG